MADDPSKRGQPDRTRISLKEEHEVSYWTDALGVTRDRLEQLVRQVGPSAQAVRDKLASGD